MTYSTVDNRMLSRIALAAPRVPWDDFVTEYLQWYHGEHFGMIGPTGQGKTTMLMNVLPLHPYVAVMATKPRDLTMEALIASGYVRLDRWRSLDPREYPRRVIWPNATTLDSDVKQREVFQDAFAKIYREGGWTTVIDETWFIANTLKMSHQIKLMLLQGRSLGISMVCASQRPAFIPLEIYDMSSHLMFWRDNDETNLKRISGISWRSAELVRNIVANLERYQVLYIDTRTGEMLRTRCPVVAFTPFVETAKTTNYWEGLWSPRQR